MDTMTAARSNVIVIVEVLTHLFACVHDYHSRILYLCGIINTKHLPDDGFTVSLKK